MGFIRSLLVEGRPPHSKDVKCNDVLVPEKVINGTELVESIDSTLETNPRGYPMVSRLVSDMNLPLIPASTVSSQDGRAGRKLWIVVNSIVLDVTDYHLKHPGGRAIIDSFGGQDCTWQWFSFHNRDIWNAVAVGLRVGRTEGVQNRHKPPRQWVGLRKFGFSFDD